MNNVSLKVAPCTYNAAKYAVEHWHYSKRMSADKKLLFGVWENEKFIGAVIYNRGSRELFTSYTKDRGGVCELTRVALRDHKTPVTKIIKETIKLIKKTQPKIEVIVSYADINQDHLGIIYQAGNWIYEGKIQRKSWMMINGEKVHGRSAGSRYGTSSIKWIREHIDPNAYYIPDKGRHKYVYPLTKKQRKLLEKRRKPYPKQ